MKKYNGIDLFKFIASLLVVMIHTGLLVERDNYIYSLIIRSAVPFFFICIGFLLANKVKKNNDEMSCFKEYIKKIIKLYIIWSIIYLPITIYNFVTTKHINLIVSLAGIVKNYVFIGEQFYSWPLWYLLCTIYSLLLIMILKKAKINNTIIFIISVVLFVIGSVYTNMMINIDNYNGITYTILINLEHLIGSSGRLFQGVLYINIGYLIADNINVFEKYNEYWYIIIAVIFFAVNIFIDLELLKAVLYISIFLVAISLTLEDNILWLYLRRSGVIIYFTHMILFFVWSLYVGFDNCKGITGFVVCICLDVVLSIIVNYINRKRNVKILNTIFN